MRFLIVGAGGIGAYYGARLQAAGHRVTMVARGDHLTAMQARGLTVDHEQFTFSEPVNAVSESELTERHPATDFDLIILAFKSQATEQWLDKMAQWLDQSPTSVLSLQNGVDNEKLLAARLGNHRTLGGLAVRIGGHIITPGHIEATGPAQVTLGPWPSAAQTPGLVPQADNLAQIFDAAGIPTQVSTEIRTELWRKLLINNGVNPLSALTRLDTRQLTHDPGYAPAVRAMMQEAAEVAVADEVTLTKNDVNDMFELISQFNAIKTSMLVDREKGRQMELEGIAGAVISRGHQLGLETPVTCLVYRLLQGSMSPQTSAQ